MKLAIICNAENPVIYFEMFRNGYREILRDYGVGQIAIYATVEDCAKDPLGDVVAIIVEESIWRDATKPGKCFKILPDEIFENLVSIPIFKGHVIFWPQDLDSLPVRKNPRMYVINWLRSARSELRTALSGCCTATAA